MIGRNDVTEPRDVKITYFPRSPWRCGAASHEGRAGHAPDSPRPGSFLFVCHSFFLKGLSSFFCLTPVFFFFVSATLTKSCQPTAVACGSASEVSPLLESSKPRLSFSRKGRRRTRKCMFQEREIERERDIDRERERERHDTSKSWVLLSISCDKQRRALLVFLSSVDELESTLAIENKSLRSAFFFPIRPATSGCHSL